MSEDAEDRGYRRGRADAGLITAAAEDQITALHADVARLEGERDEARTAWAGAVTRLEDAALALGDWRDFQMGARTARSEPQSDAEGSGVAQDIQEAVGAQTGAQGACTCPWNNGYRPTNRLGHHISCPALTGSHAPDDDCARTGVPMCGHRDA